MNSLLTRENLEVLITSCFPNEKAKIISTNLIQKCFIYKKHFYVYQENVTYKKISCDEMKSKIYKITTQLIEDSFKGLNDENQRLLIAENSGKGKTHYSTIFTNTSVDKYYPQLLNDLTKDEDEITFDLTIGEIHFNNGYMNLKTKKFEPRDKTKHFITKYIQRDYVASSESQRNIIYSHIKKIIPNEDDLKCILTVFGSALSGNSVIDQDTLFMLGKGSAGKSFLLSLTQTTVECYLQVIQANMFCADNGKIDKILNTFGDSAIRYIWINEMEDKRMNESLFKSFCEGLIQTTKLYADGQVEIKHYAKVIVTGNVMPVIKIDTGVTRRFKGYEHTSQFIKPEDVTDNNTIDEKNHRYLADTKLIEKLSEQKLLDAFFDILVEYCNKWMNGEKPQWTANFQETSENVMASNDWIKDFVDSQIIITGDDKNRIGKENMMKKLKLTYPDRHLNMGQMITSLKAKNLKYESQMRCDHMQGCFVGVKFRNTTVEYNTEQLENNTYEQIINDKDKEISELKARISALEAMDIFTTLYNTINEMKPIILPTKKETKPIIKQTTTTNSNKCVIDFGDEYECAPVINHAVSSNNKANSLDTLYSVF